MHCVGTGRGHSALLPVGIKTPFLFYCAGFWAGGGSKILSFPFKVCADGQSDNSSDLQPVVLGGCWGGSDQRSLLLRGNATAPVWGVYLVHTPKWELESSVLEKGGQVCSISSVVLGPAGCLPSFRVLAVLSDRLACTSANQG